MSAPDTKEVNCSITVDGTHSKGSHEVEDVGKAAASSSAPITSEEVARQFRAVIDPLTKHLENLSDLITELKT